MSLNCSSCRRTELTSDLFISKLTGKPTKTCLKCRTRDRSSYMREYRKKRPDVCNKKRYRTEYMREYRERRKTKPHVEQSTTCASGSATVPDEVPKDTGVIHNDTVEKGDVIECN